MPCIPEFVEALTEEVTIEVLVVVTVVLPFIDQPTNPPARPETTMARINPAATVEVLIVVSSWWGLVIKQRI
jgi:hypothetical protein